MNADAASVALNVLAFLGAGAYVLGQWSARESTPVDTRLASLFALLMALVGVRAARWGFGEEGLRHIEEALAALVPLLSLLLAEGLLRRHAPGRFKQTVTLTSGAFAVVALVRPDSLAPLFAILLGAYMTMSLAAIAILLAGRDRSALAHGENDAISALFVGLIVALPLAATDFLAAADLAPIRAGGLALLVIVFAAARVTAIGGGGLGVLSELLWSTVAAALGFAVLAYVLGWPQGVEAVRVFALVASLVLVLRIVQFVREQAQARRRSSLWRAFAEAPASGVDAFLAHMLAAPELEGARLLEGAALADYDHERLRGAFERHAVISAAEARADPGAAQEQLDVIFATHEATHAALVSATPLRLLLVNLPRIGAGPDADVQLRVLAKLAVQADAHA